VHRRPIALAFAVAASAVMLAGVAYGSTVPWSRQDKQLVRACVATRRSTIKAMNEAGSPPASTIESSLDVVTPLVLWARVYFGSNGTVTVNGDSFAGCSRPVTRARALGPERARIVAALHETFATPGRYTLTFVLTRPGQKLMARLGAAQRAYRRRHPRGHQPPQIVVSVALGYAPIG
jgi:hypothetical protein